MWLVCLANCLRTSWLERGVADGAPLVHFHGWPSSRLEQFASDELLRELGIRWFSLDRPGYGGTKYVRGLRAWTEMVEEWADERGLGRFHVLGFSAGGQSAQAVAACLPERVLSLNLIGSLCPFGEGGVNYPPPWAGSAEFILKRAPLLGVAGLSVLNAYRKWKPLDYERRLLSGLHPADRAILEGPGMLEAMAEAHGEAMRQGVWHIVEDLRMLAGAWDVDFEAIRCPARIWVGGEDFQVPVACSRWLAGRLKDAKLVEFAGEAHYIAHRHAREILEVIKSAGS